MGLSVLWADPLEKVGPDQSLYQRVRNLGHAGLLDAKDQAVLDHGVPMTRLQLAFYVEKTRANMQNPSPSTSAPMATQAPTPVLIVAAEAPVAAPQASAQSAPSPDQLNKEIKDLLKELRQEDALLKNRLYHDERLTAKRDTENAQVKTDLDSLDKIYRKSDKSSGSNHLIYENFLKVENIDVSGATTVRAYHSEEDMNLGFNSDLGGKGYLGTGIAAALPFGNASSAPASITLLSPKITYGLDGMLGHWDNTLTIEDYLGDTDLGDFTRGQSAGVQRYEKPFDIKNYSEDKNQKTWDDYMDNLGYVASVQTFATGSNAAKVFDGLLMKGSRLPWVGRDAMMTLLFGPTDSVHRWEEGAKFSRTWYRGKINTNVSTLWVNDHLGAPQTVSMDMRTYAAEVGLDVLPVFMDLEGATSGFMTGTDTQAVGTPKRLWDDAFMSTFTYYPFNLYGSYIGEDFTNYQSKVTVQGVDFNRYGLSNFQNQYGYVGMADTLISNRHGGRIDLGWKGRQSAWMKSWPKFLDAFVLKADAALFQEERSVTDSTTGYNDLNVDLLSTVYYPDATGVWGNNIWGGYSGAHPLGTATTNNILSERNDGQSSVTLFTYGMSSVERIPLMVPILGADGSPVTNAAGHNQYTLLTNQKTYRYLTGTLKVKFNKLLNVSRAIDGGFFYTDNEVSGSSSDAALAATADPNRPGQTLAKIPNLFSQRVWDASLMVNTLKYVNVMGDYALEKWICQYTYPQIDSTTTSIGAGLAYDFPWGGGKFELRFKHLTFKDVYVSANNYQANQTYATFLFKF
jgi:hypothetical protein